METAFPMPDVHIHRAHQLGLARARELSRQWVADAGRQYDMVCTVSPGESTDTVDFKRTGVSGQLVVSATHFELTARLGMLLGAFQKSIEGEIARNLDTLLAREVPPPIER